MLYMLNCVYYYVLWVAQLEERQTVMVTLHLNVTGSNPVPEIYLFLGVILLLFRLYWHVDKG